MKQFVAIATEFNVLNCVAVFALAEPGDRVTVLADPLAAALGYADRLDRVLRCRNLQPDVIEVPDWSLGSIHAAVRRGVPATNAVSELIFLAIGGRKHDAMVLQDVLREHAGHGVQVRTVSVDRGPPSLRISGVRAGEAFLDAVGLHAIDAGSAISLAEVLQVHGFRLNRGERLRFEDPVPSIPARERIESEATGIAFEHRVLTLAHRHLDPDLRPLVSGLWWGAEISESARTGAGMISTELDVLLLLRDGSAIHFECKSGGTGGGKAMQAKLFQLRRAFTPKSAMVLCRLVTLDPEARAPADAIRALQQNYANLGRFDVLCCASNMTDTDALGVHVGSARDQFNRIAANFALDDPSGMVLPPPQRRKGAGAAKPGKASVEATPHRAPQAVAKAKPKAEHHQERRHRKGRAGKRRGWSPEQ